MHDDCVLMWNDTEAEDAEIVNKKIVEAVEVLLRSSRDRDFNFDFSLDASEGKECLADSATDYFKLLSESQFKERCSLDTYLKEKNPHQ